MVSGNLKLYQLVCATNLTVHVSSNSTRVSLEVELFSHLLQTYSIGRQQLLNITNELTIWYSHVSPCHSPNCSPSPWMLICSNKYTEKSIFNAPCRIHYTNNMPPLAKIISHFENNKLTIKKLIVFVSQKLRTKKEKILEKDASGLQNSKRAEPQQKKFFF